MTTDDIFFFLLGFIAFGISALMIDFKQSRKYRADMQRWRDIAEESQAENEQLRREIANNNVLPFIQIGGRNNG